MDCVGIGVLEGVCVAVAVGAGGLVAVLVGGEKSGVLVAVLVGVERSGVLVGVMVGVRVSVMVMPGVLVGTFGTQSSCPMWMMVDDPMQLADCNCATEVRYRREMR